jgi:hypothetical protein
MFLEEFLVLSALNLFNFLILFDSRKGKKFPRRLLKINGKNTYACLCVCVNLNIKLLKVKKQSNRIEKYKNHVQKHKPLFF